MITVVQKYNLQLSLCTHCVHPEYHHELLLYLYIIAIVTIAISYLYIGPYQI